MFARLKGMDGKMNFFLNQKWFYSIYFLPFLLSALFLPIYSDSPRCEESREPLLLDTVVIKAEKPEDDRETGDVEKEQLPSFYTVIDRESFEGKMENLSQVIEKEAGIQVRQSGALGSFSTISLRGSSSEQVMVYLDGIPLNDASGGGVDLSNISLSDVESIEIYRGIAPINFGKTAIGGVVNIRTIRKEKGLTGGVTTGYGSFNTRKANAFINHKPDKWDYIISADYFGSDNDFEFTNDNGTAYNPHDDRTEDRNNAGFEQYNVLAKFGYDFTGDVRADFFNQWFSKDQELPGWNNSEKTETTFDTKRNITTASFRVDNMGKYHINSRYRIDYTTKTEEYDDSKGHIGLGTQHTEYNTDRFGANGFFELLTDIQAISLVLDYQHETYSPEDLLTKDNPHDSKRDQFSASLSDSLLFFSEKLIVNPAVGFTCIRDELESALNDEGLPLEGNERTENYFTPQLGIKYRLFDWLSLKSNIARYIREPSFFELFGDRGFFMGNDDLEAEKGTNFDFGVDAVRVFEDDSILSRISLETVGFYNDVDDLITRVYDARGIGRSENISESTIKGIELKISADFLSWFRFSGNATFQDAENQSRIGHMDGKQLPGRFEKSYLLRLEGLYKGFKAFTEYQVKRDMYYDTPNLLKAENQEVINAGISWLYKSWRFDLEANNIADDIYEDFNGYPTPGRSYFFNVKYSW